MFEIETSPTGFFANRCSVSVDMVPVGNQIILFMSALCGVRLFLCCACQVPHPALFIEDINPPLSPFQMWEVIRQDTVCVDKEVCLFKTHSLRVESRPLVALKGKAR